MIVAQRLKDLNLTQTAFGQSLDPPVTQPVVSQWLRGKERIPDFRRSQIAKKLDIDPALLESPSGFVRTTEQINEWRDAMMMNTPNVFAMAALNSFPMFMRANGECHLTEEEIANIVPTLSLDRVIEAWPAVLNSPLIERVGKARWVFRLKLPQDL